MEAHGIIDAEMERGVRIAANSGNVLERIVYVSHTCIMQSGIQRAL